MLSDVDFSLNLIRRAWAAEDLGEHYLIATDEEWDRLRRLVEEQRFPTIEGKVVDATHKETRILFVRGVRVISPSHSAF